MPNSTEPRVVGVTHFLKPADGEVILTIVVPGERAISSGNSAFRRLAVLEWGMWTVLSRPGSHGATPHQLAIDA